MLPSGRYLVNDIDGCLIQQDMPLQLARMGLLPSEAAGPKKRREHRAKGILQKKSALYSMADALSYAIESC